MNHCQKRGNLFGRNVHGYQDTDCLPANYVMFTENLKTMQFNEYKMAQTL